MIQKGFWTADTLGIQKPLGLKGHLCRPCYLVDINPIESAAPLPLALRLPQELFGHLVHWHPSLAALLLDL